jgi:hypothetical protein
MLIHDRFVFIHVPKTGGRFVSEALSHEVQGCTDPYGPQHRHYGWDKIPAEATGRPVLAFVRNPWDWYVSWYSFAVADRPATGFHRALAERPLLRRLITARSADTESSTITVDDIDDFATTVGRACGGILEDSDEAELARLADESPMARLLMEGHDFYTARLTVVLGPGSDSELLKIGRFESLTDDLLSFLEDVGLGLSGSTVAKIRAMEPVGASRRSHYREYYDDDLRDLVGRSCKALIDRFEYTF